MHPFWYLVLRVVVCVVFVLSGWSYLSVGIESDACLGKVQGGVRCAEICTSNLAWFGWVLLVWTKVYNSPVSPLVWSECVWADV